MLLYPLHEKYHGLEHCCPVLSHVMDAMYSDMNVSEGGDHPDSISVGAGDLSSRDRVAGM